MLIRRATLRDVPAIVDLALEAVSADPLPLVASRERIAIAAQTVIADNGSFCWVAEDDSGIQACVAAEVGPGFWFERMQASVLMFFTRKAGAGVMLLREFARWLKSRPAIKAAIFALEPHADPRIGKLLVRLGFKHQSMQFSYVRGS